MSHSWDRSYSQPAAAMDETNQMAATGMTHHRDCGSAHSKIRPNAPWIPLMKATWLKVSSVDGRTRSEVGLHRPPSPTVAGVRKQAPAIGATSEAVGEVLATGTGACQTTLQVAEIDPLALRILRIKPPAAVHASGTADRIPLTVGVHEDEAESHPGNPTRPLLLPRSRRTVAGDPIGPPSAGHG